MHASLRIALFAALLAGCLDRVQVGQVAVAGQDRSTSKPNMSFFDLTATDIHGQPVGLDRFRGRKVMVVNTASECGYTPQYAQLQELYATYEDKGFVVIGFPSNDFGGQEPGSEAQIAEFCQKNFGVTFPLMSKVSVKGAQRHPVFQWLANKSQNAVMDTEVKWNFHKYLIDEHGGLVMSLESGIEPSDERITNWIEGK